MIGNKPKIHHAWLIMLACCLMQGGIIGVVQNCRGLFYTPVTADLGVAMGKFTFYATIHGIAACLFLPLAGKLLPRKNINVVVFIACTVFAASTGAMGAFTSVWQWYIAGAIQGMAGAFIIYITTPLLIFNWFREKTGIVIGLCSACTGIVGFIMNPIGSYIIENFSWRIGYFVFGIVAFMLSAPLFLIVVRLHPEEKGLEPYGKIQTISSQEAETLSDNLECSNSLINKITVLLVIPAFAMGFLSGNSQFFPSFAAHSGWLPAVGALMVSASMVGNIAGKLACGALIDAVGSKKSTLLCIGCVTLGTVSLLLFPVESMAMFSGVFAGFSMSFNMVATPDMVRSCLGRINYQRILPYVSMATAIGLSTSQTVLGAMRDFFNSYNEIFLLCTIICVIAIISSYTAYMISPYWKINPKSKSKATN